MDYGKAMERLLRARRFPGRRAASGHPCATAATFPLRNAVFFLAVSVYSKVLLLDAAGFDWLSLATLRGIMLLLRTFSADAWAAAVVFFSAFALMAAASRMNCRWHATAASYILQLAYFIYCLAYVEFYRTYSAPLTLSALLQATWLWRIAYATTLTALYSVDWLAVAFLSAAAALTSIIVLPASERALRESANRRGFFAAAAMMFVLCPLAYAYYEPALDSSGTGDLEANPLAVLILSSYHRVMFYCLDKPPGDDFAAETGGQRIVIDREYPLMAGTEYAICSEPALLNSPGFEVMCRLDEDGDGLTKAFDPDDHNPSVNIASGPKHVRNVILIVLESQDASTMQIYDPALNNTPNLASFRNISLVARNFYSSVGTSLRGEYMTYCSLYPYEDMYSFNLMPLFEVPCLPDILSRKGYRTAYFISTDSNWGDTKESLNTMSWGEYISPENWTMPTDGFAPHVWGWEDRIMLIPFLRWIDADRTKPFFAVLRCTLGHLPITLPKKYYVYPSKAQDVALYSDSFIGDIMRNLEARRISEDTLVVIVSDHSSAEHRYEMGRIPLVMINPRLFGGGAESREPASQLDVAPTIMDALGIQTINSFQGKSLYNQPEDPERSIFFAYETGLLGVRRAGMLYSYDINSKSARFVDEANTSITDPEAEERLRKSLFRWQATYKKLYLERRLFDRGLFKTGRAGSVINASCWPYAGDLTAYQWAADANASSWNASGGDFAPAYATGIPDRPPVTTSVELLHESWAPRTNLERDWLETYYAKPGPVESVIICKGRENSSICGVELIDESGGRHIIAGLNDTGGRRSWRMDLIVNATDYSVKGVRISTCGTGQAEIDAVGIR